MNASVRRQFVRRDGIMLILSDIKDSPAACHLRRQSAKSGMAASL